MEELRVDVRYSLRTLARSPAFASIAILVLGLALSIWATRLLRTLLFEIEPVDPLTLALTAGLVVAVTLAASYLPARRASLIEPVVALRHE
jgi:ABC-type lipoprotein release transport system permease subunit